MEISPYNISKRTLFVAYFSDTNMNLLLTNIFLPVHILVPRLSDHIRDAISFSPVMKLLENIHYLEARKFTPPRLSDHIDEVVSFLPVIKTIGKYALLRSKKVLPPTFGPHS